MPSYRTYAGRRPWRERVHLCRRVWKKDNMPHLPTWTSWNVVFGEDAQGRPIVTISRADLPDMIVRLQEKEDEIGNEQAGV